MYHQDKGGPIGLRATCAIARMVMQYFDKGWEEKHTRLNIKIWLNTRYMDDGRLMLPPIKRGWRWEGGKVQFCKRWELEDSQLSLVEVTRRIIAGTLGGVKSYLEFTTEVGEDFVDGWLPTLDTALRVDENNKIQYRFYEKPEGARSTLQQTLSQEMIRRLLNCSEDLPDEQIQRITDNYAAKLHNSGYNIEQIRKIILSGVKGFGAKKTRCFKDGRRLGERPRKAKEQGAKQN